MLLTDNVLFELIKNLHKMATQICHERSHTGHCQLLLPNATPTDTVSLNIGGITFQVQFGNIFDAETPNWIPIIPNFLGGQLLSELSRRTNIEHFDNSLKYQLVETGIPEIPRAILYIYDRYTHRLESEFEEIANMCPDGSILVFPTIGVNNGMSFHKSAFDMFHSITSCLETEESNLRRMSKIIIMTIFDSNQDNGGTRTIRHLLNMVNVYNKTSANKTCAICMSSRVDTILSCGHYIMCSRCVIDIHGIGNICPICKVHIHNAYPCYTTEDACGFKCCQGYSHEKEKKICVPCGHFNIACNGCSVRIETEKKCPVCNMDVYAYVPYFDS
jgi:hypothetical protein